MNLQRAVFYSVLGAALGATLGAAAQDPSPPLPPESQSTLPALSPAPTQRSVPPGPVPETGPATHAKPPAVSALAAGPVLADAPSALVKHAEDGRLLPERENARGLRPDFLGFLGRFAGPMCRSCTRAMRVD